MSLTLDDDDVNIYSNIVKAFLPFIFAYKLRYTRIHIGRLYVNYILRR